ncbi:MAG TPA: biopolymer transporter ExbD [Polyangia bacterium]|jgi:biopolymer transport protein ExbD|nr:biopolymer transporter ExbD [Polyangia bacterium]
MAGTGPQYEDDDGGSGATISEINVTPLVDVTLVLLIIMMVAAPLIVNNPSIKVELPKAATGDETPKSTISLTLRKDGTLYYGEDKVTEPMARDRIKADAAKNQQIQAVIAGDKGVPYGDVMHLIDLVKSLGVTRFALNIDATP